MQYLLQIACVALSLHGQALAAAVPEQRVIDVEGIKDIPLLGFGTWNLQKSNGSEAVATAIEAGFRHIDAGAGIAAGLRRANLYRRDIWVTSKLWNDAHDLASVPRALDATLSDLGLDYLDLYLMHWPVSKSADGTNAIDFQRTWRALEAAQASGKARRIGISNFSPDQLRALLAHARTPPYAHQLEAHPYLPQADFLRAHAEHRIRVTAYSPLGNTNPTYGSTRKQGSSAAVPALLRNPVVLRVAERRGCTAAQVALAWGTERGTSVIPKATTPEHIKENLDATKCRLESVDLKELAELPVKRFNNPSKNWGVKLFGGLEDARVSGLRAAGHKVLEAAQEGGSLIIAAIGKFMRPVGDL